MEAGLLRLSHDLAYTHSLQELPRLILHGVRALVEYDRGLLWIAEGDEFCEIGAQPERRSSADPQRALPAAAVLVVCQREQPPRPIVLEGLREEEPIVRSLLGEEPASVRLPGMEMIVPLVLRESVIGLLAGVVAWRTRNVFLTLIVGMASLWGVAALLR